jgi:hypothetical protein
MTIEEKARAYDEAIERWKQIQDTPYTAHLGIMEEVAEYLLPELKESEDERIKKAIGYAIGQSTHLDGTLINGVSSEEAIAWLEKQCKHANFRNKIQVGDKVTRNQDGVLVNLSQLKRVAKPADKVEPKFCIGDVVKRGLSTLRISSINFMKRFYELSTKEGIVVSCVPFLEQDNWELVAKDTTIRPKYCLMSNSLYCPYYNKQQHAWSKEDEERYISCLQRLGTGDPKQPETINSKWFKEHVYPQSTWKPSGEQMKQLGWIAEQNKDNMIGKELMSLYQDLKKLKGE